MWYLDVCIFCDDGIAKLAQECAVSTNTALENFRAFVIESLCINVLDLSWLEQDECFNHVVTDWIDFSNTHAVVAKVFYNACDFCLCIWLADAAFADASNQHLVQVFATEL